MLLRIRSKDGNFRFELQPTDNVSVLIDKILETSPEAELSTITISAKPRGDETLVSTLKGQTLGKLGLTHGDLVFVGYKPRQAAPSGAPEPTASTALPSSSEPRIWETVEEDAVDRYLRTQDGKIPRSRDLNFCKHGPNGMCDYCMPLEPYDAAHHKENAIKHLSYHAYLRKITPKTSSTAIASLPPLTPPSYTVKSPCPSGGHPAWPAGICTSCQPSAITLKSQAYRMVDHLEIASPEIIERFLAAWRVTGLQRFGWLIGRYEPYDKVPMGLKAVVEAIYEPPQEGELDGLSLGIPWEEEPRIRELARQASTPLSIVGYVFTDLDPTPDDRTKNVYKRHPESFFLSSLEAIFAATLQKANPCPSRSSRTGAFSSRLVTAVLTATVDGQVDIAAYQVSEQAEAMVEADMIEASVDPGIVRVKEDDQASSRYVPDVFFSYKNEYGLEVKKSAKPCFPVEYLLVNVTHGFPQKPSPLFRSTQFSIENRAGFEDQRLESVISNLLKLDAPNIPPSAHSNGKHNENRIALARWLSDCHLLAFLGTTQLFSPQDMNVLMHTLSQPNLLEQPSLLDPIFATDGWQTLMTFTRESASSGGQPSDAMDEDIPQDVLDQIAAADAAASVGGPGGVRVCPHCTFENDHGGDCDVCGLPL